jgi:hypothetical protein
MTQVQMARASTLAVRRPTGRFIGTKPEGPKKVGRNDPCPCGSGRKFKKCHLAMQNGTYVRDPTGAPKPKLDDATVTTAAASPAAPANKNSTAIAMRNAKIADRIVWAYLETGIYMTENNRAAHPPETVVKWEAALQAYDAATPEEQQIMLAPAVA